MLEGSDRIMNKKIDNFPSKIDDITDPINSKGKKAEISWTIILRFCTEN